MSWVRLVNLILLISDQIKAFLVKQKKAQIIEAKNRALETGDQRDFENSLTDEDVVIDLPPGSYNGMFERAAKKKP